MNETRVYTNPHWQQILADNQLNNFEALWQLDIPAVDEGNHGRGQNSWSQVCIHRLNSATGNPHRMVIKRQSNYRSRTPRHPIRGISTFIKEYNFIRRYEKLGIPALKVIYCATRQQGKETQVILATEYLEGYRPLSDIQEGWTGKDSWKQRASVVRNVAQLVAKLHCQRLEHRCLYPKHIFIKTKQPSTQACLIDLETTRWKPWGYGLPSRDLSTLARRTSNVTNRDRILFLRHYLGIMHLDTRAKKLWRQVERRINRKHPIHHDH